jgi:D-amino peptidase
MRILIWNDMEGPTGIDRSEMLEDSNLYEQARILATDDVNAAINGINRANPEALIDIFDGHGMGGNLILERLKPHDNFLGGGWMTTFYQMVKKGEVKEYDAVLLLGQHAAEGTENAFLNHTNTGLTALKVNGKYAGEAPQLAWLFGHFDVPVLLVVGDEACIREVKALLHGIETVVVKKSISKDYAESLPLEKAHKYIDQAAFNVIMNISSFKPYKVNLPVRIGIYYFTEEMAEIHSKFPRTVRKGKNSVEYIAEDYLEGWLAYNICRIISKYYLRAEGLKLLKELDGAIEVEKKFIDIFKKKLKEEYPFETVKY